MKMKKFWVMVLCGVMLVSAAACTKSTSGSVETDTADTSKEATENAGKTVVLRFANCQTSGHPWISSIDEFSALAEEYSNGRLKIEQYSDSTLGSETELMDQVVAGTLDMCVIDPSVGASYSNKLELFALPFLFQDKEQWKKALTGEAGKEYANLIEEETELKILAYWGGSTRNVLSAKEAITDASQLKGYKLRLTASELKFNVWEAVGCLPVEVAIGETYSALSSNLCDGMENEMPAFLSFKFYEVAPYLTKTEHEITVRPVFINEDVFNGLDTELQDALVKAMDETTPHEWQAEEDYCKEAETTMINDFGLQEFEIDKEPIIKAVQPVFAEFGEKNGLTEVIQMIQGL